MLSWSISYPREEKEHYLSSFLQFQNDKLDREFNYQNYWSIFIAVHCFLPRLSPSAPTLVSVMHAIYLTDVWNVVISN